MLKLHAQGVLIECFGLGDDIHAGFQAVRPLRLHVTNAKSRGFGSKRRTIRKIHALAQLKNIFGAIVRDLPRGRQMRNHRTVIVDAYQSFIHISQQRAGCGRTTGIGEIQRTGSRGCCHHDGIGTAGTRVIGGVPSRTPGQH